MFDGQKFMIGTGAVTEIRDAFVHVATETEAECNAIKMRLENLEFKAEGVVSHVATAVREDADAILSDVKIGYHHVGMTFSELLAALRHPVRAGAALQQADGDPGAENPAFASALAHPPSNFPL